MGWPKGKPRENTNGAGGSTDTWHNGHACKIVTKYINCGKCPKRHGPYNYLQWRDNDGKVKSKYLGKWDTSG